jgi:acid stress-induced BolA-like protein IbaG/YrbA
METEAVAQLIRAGLPDAQVQVSGDGSHFEALVVSAAFLGKGPLERQRLVMATVRPQLESGELHALSIKAQIPGPETDQGG